MKWKEFLRDYFVFTRKERIGLVVLLLTTIGIWIFPKVSRAPASKTVSPDTSWITAARRLMVEPNDSIDRPVTIDVLAYETPIRERRSEQERQLFYFDPNTLSREGWSRLGLREKTIVTIQNYLRKGGKFNKPEDLKKIYGIRPDEYTRLEPYAKIATLEQPHVPKEAKFEYKKETGSSGQKYPTVDINVADTSSFIALPGIGNKLALRIVNFRDKLGGFYSIDQIGEVYGLPDSSFQKIKPFLRLQTTTVRKMNINSATKDEMRSHPYLKWNLANAIVEYRNQHGNFSSLEELKKISLITTEVFDKVRFYLAL